MSMIGGVNSNRRNCDSGACSGENVVGCMGGTVEIQANKNSLPICTPSNYDRTNPLRRERREQPMILAPPGPHVTKVASLWRLAFCAFAKRDQP